MNLTTHRFRTINWWRDRRDQLLRGLCCAVPGEGSGGYHFWRCGRERGHVGPHRFGNYIWAGPGHRVKYLPDAPQRIPPRPERYPTPTRKQMRNRASRLDAHMRAQGRL